MNKWVRIESDEKPSLFLQKPSGIYVRIKKKWSDYMTFSEERNELLTKSPHFKEKRNDVCYFGEKGDYYIAQQRIGSQYYPFGWGHFGGSGNEKEFPFWFRELYANLNDLYFNQMKMKSLVNQSKLRPIQNIAYVCAYTEARDYSMN